MNLDTLTAADAAAAHRLSTQAGWSVRERDWRRMLSTPGVRGFAGRIDGALVATATVAVYEAAHSDSVAWIGSILVDEAHRREGYGTQIFDAALGDAADRATVVGLDANDDGRPIYEDAGFLSVAPAEKWRGTLAVDTVSNLVAASGGVRADPSLHELAKVDTAACGVDRRNLLGPLLDEPTSRAFGWYDDVLRGYVVVRPSAVGWTIGPLVAPDDTVAGALLAAVARETGDDTVTINVAGNPNCDDLSLQCGLELNSTLARMTYETPSRPLVDETIWAAPGFAWG